MAKQAARTRRNRPDGGDELSSSTRLVRKPKRNGARRANGNGKGSSIDPTSPSVPPTDWRFYVASLMRVSDNLVSRAVNAYDRTFALDKREQSEIYLEIGKKLASEEKIDDALRALRKVVQAKPDHAEALYEIGVLHVRRGVPRAAIEVLEKAKAAGMRTVRLHLLLADVLGREERFGEALEEIDSAIALKPTVSDTHYRRGVLLDRIERHEEAIDAFEEAVRLSPGEIRYHQSLGFALETAGRRGAAIKCFKRALELERQREIETSYSDE